MEGRETWRKRWGDTEVRKKDTYCTCTCRGKGGRSEHAVWGGSEGGGGGGGGVQNTTSCMV